MHPASADTIDRFCHERRVQAAHQRHRLDRELEGDDVICGVEGVAVLEVDLVLAPSHLVVRRLDLEPHLGEGDDDLAPEILCKVGRCEVKVAADVLEECGWLVVDHPEEEELQFRTGVKEVAILRGILHGHAEHVARVALERLAALLVDIAHKARHRVIPGPPGQEGVSGEVGFQHHIRLLDPDKPLNRGSVKTDAAGQRLLSLLDRDGDVFGHAQEVGELEAEESDIILLDAVKHRRSDVARHVEAYFYPME